MEGQEAVKCRNCEEFGKSGSAAMRGHGFGSCDVLVKRNAAASAYANATYKSAEYDRQCGAFKPKKEAGEGRK